MNVCSDGHKEICHDEHARDCPFCEAIAEHNDEIKERDGEIASLKEQIEELEAEIDRLNEPFRVACREALQRG